MNDPQTDLHKLANYKMPFGKHKGMPLVDLPEPYVIWFYKNGLPSGELGRLFGILYEIKLNGLEYLFNDIRCDGKIRKNDLDPIS